MDLKKPFQTDVEQTLYSEENGLLKEGYIDECQCRSNLRYFLKSIANATEHSIEHHANMYYRHTRILQKEPSLRKCKHIWQNTNLHAALQSINK